MHVHHGLRGAEADADAAHCAEAFDAEIVYAQPAATEAELREHRYSVTAGRGLRATGHTATDQVETVLYRLVSSGSTRGIRSQRADGVVRPLLDVWRAETEGYCRAHCLSWRVDSTNADTKRGLIRERLLPLLEELDPRARSNLLALASERPRLPRALEASLVGLLSSREGTRAADLGGGVRAVRAYDTLRLEGVVTWGPWRLETDRAGRYTQRPHDVLLALQLAEPARAVAAVERRCGHVGEPTDGVSRRRGEGRGEGVPNYLVPQCPPEPVFPAARCGSPSPCSRRSACC